MPRMEIRVSTKGYSRTISNLFPWAAIATQNAIVVVSFATSIQNYKLKAQKVFYEKVRERQESVKILEYL